MINNKGVRLIKSREELRLKAYICPAGVPTIGWGTTRGVTHQDVIDGRTETEQWCQEQFKIDVDIAASAVSALCKVTPTGNQLAAMTSLAQNIGNGAFAKSSVLKAHNRGDFSAAGRAFLLWNKAKVNGKLQILNGLTARRAEEMALYLEDDAAETAATGRVQAVEPPTTLPASPTMQASVVTVATTALAGAKELFDAIGGVKGSLATIGDWVGPILLLVGLGAGCYLIWKRFQLRKEGRL